MIFRTYVRRERRFAGKVSDSSSQDFSQDVYDFTFKPDPYDFNSSQESGKLGFSSNKLKMVEVDSSQESKKSGGLRMSDGVSQKPKKHKKVSFDPYDYNSSQGLEEFSVQPQRKGAGSALLPPRKDSGFRKSKKSKIVEVDSKSFGKNPFQESKKFGNLRICDGDYQKPKKLKKGSLNTSDQSSSKELEKSVILSQRKCGEDSVFDFCEDDDLCESKTAKYVDVDSYVLNSSHAMGDLGISRSRKRESHRDYLGLDGISGKSKKNRDEINPDPYDYNSSQELEGYTVLSQSKARENTAFDLSKDSDLWESKKSKNFDSDSHTLNSSQELPDLCISQSRKCGGYGESKKNCKGENGALQKKKTKKLKSKEPEEGYVELTATLMETQESGEMMEHEDEVYFAVDGMKKGQPVKIRRASLLSLLSICGTVQKRRHLKINGMEKTIIDAVLGLSFDDMPSNLAAAALVYILTIDGQDDYLLDSPSCIRFLINLLKPLSPSTVKEKSLPIGSKLLSLCKNVGFLQESAKGTDSSSTDIMIKVREILVNCKDMKSRDDNDDGIEDPELNPKWISLLTMEKACSSRISIEDTSGIRKTGGKFKEKLRQFGGLDAVFEVARKCHSVMEEWSEKSPTFALDSREIMGLESLVLLLKSLKVIENALFLSNDNQRHLLGMKGNFDDSQAPRTLTKLVLSVIKILSGVSLLRKSSPSSQDEKTGCISYGAELNSQESFTHYGRETKSDALMLKLRAESSQPGLCSGTSRNLDSVVHMSDDSEIDRFAFDDDEIEPSKWVVHVLSGSSQKSLSQDSKTRGGGRNGYKCRSVPLESQQESNNVERCQTQEASCSPASDENTSNLLEDCLLTAVKVLMNMTNENPEGCRQIATCGGLEILSSLIADHFSSFSTHAFEARDSSSTSKSSSKTNQQINTHLTDRELDFLVALLGLLVNLIEKDSRNRSRLAAATVSLPNPDSEDQSDVIFLLCSIFLANQGTNEAAGEGTCLSLDEDSILQGEKEAEKMIVEAYSALLLAFLSTESQNVRSAIGECLPGCNLKTLVPVLERFLEFHMTLNMISQETHTAVLEVVESCRVP